MRGEFRFNIRKSNLKSSRLPVSLFLSLSTDAPMLSTRRATTSPTTRSAGASSFASRTSAAIVASVPMTMRASGIVAFDMTAAGVSGRAPARRRAPRTSPRAGRVPCRRRASLRAARSPSRSSSPVCGVRACAKRHAGRALAVRERDGRRRGRSQRRRDAGDDLEGNARGRELLGLFSATAEDERIAALEAHDVLALERALDDERMDARLVVPAAAGAPARPGCAPRWRGQREHVRGHELVVGDDRGVREEAVRADREQLGIARAGADEPDLAPTNRAHSVDTMRSCSPRCPSVAR